MFGLKIFVRVQTFRRAPPVRPCNFCHPGLTDKITPSAPLLQFMTEVTSTLNARYTNSVQGKSSLPVAPLSLLMLSQKVQNPPLINNLIHKCGSFALDQESKAAAPPSHFLKSWIENFNPVSIIQDPGSQSGSRKARL